MINNAFRFFSICLFIPIFISSCASLKPDILIPSKQPTSNKTIHHPRIALVLGGGGSRGYAHVGVIKALEKEGVPIDLIIGTSAGSIMGAIYADSASSKKLENITMSANFWDYADIANMPLFGGVMSGNNLQNFLVKNLKAKTFDNLAIPLVVVTTDFRKGVPYIIKGGPIPPAVLASSAVPGVVRPVYLYGKILVDGGVVDNVAVDIAEKYHPKIIIAVDVSSDLEDAKPGSEFSILFRSYSITLKKLSNLQLSKTSFIIKPNLSNIGMFDMSQKNKLVTEGYKAAEKIIPKIKKVMLQKNIVSLNKDFKNKNKNKNTNLN